MRTSHPAPALRPGVLSISPQLGWTGVAVFTVWLSVLLASVFSPDFIHGSQQDHLAIAAITWWFWGLIATAFLLVPLAVHGTHEEGRPGAWMALGGIGSAIWLVSMLLSIFTERHVTGADPTQFPIAAVFAPAIAMVLTGLLSSAVLLWLRRPT